MRGYGRFGRRLFVVGRSGVARRRQTQYRNPCAAGDSGRRGRAGRRAERDDSGGLCRSGGQDTRRRRVDDRRPVRYGADHSRCVERLHERSGCDARRSRRGGGRQTRSDRFALRRSDAERHRDAGGQIEPSGVVHRTPVQPRARHDAPSLQRQVPVARFPGGDRYAHDVRLLRRVLQDGSLDARRRRLRGRMALARSGAAACARSVPRFPRAGAGLYRDHEEVERCRDGSRTTHASQGELARLQGAVAGAVLSVREDACAVRRCGRADRSFADRCFARAVAQHGRFYAVVALAHQSARSGQTRTDLR